MKFFPILWSWVWRRPTRTVFTALTVVVAFFLFGLLEGMNIGIGNIIGSLHADRLYVSNRVNMLSPEPLANLERIKKVGGVTDVTTWTFLGGYYQDVSHQIPVIAIDPSKMFSMYPEVQISPAQIEAMTRMRTGAIVGKTLADQFGWKVGDRIPIKSPVAARADGSHDWSFDIVGIFTVKEPSPIYKNSFFINYSYFDEARAFLKGTVHMFLVTIDNPGHAENVSSQIDAMFRNSPFETRTQTEQAYARQQIDQIADINLITNMIIGAVMFTLLLIVLNTLMQAVNERTPEFAVMKTFGYSDRRIFSFVLLETIFICATSALCGLLLSVWLYPRLGHTRLTGQFSTSGTLPIAALIDGLAISVGVGVLSGLLPAVRVRRLRVADAITGRRLP